MEARTEIRTTSGFWNPRRFGQLLLRELVSGYRGLLIAMAAVGGSLVLITALSAIGIAVGGAPARASTGFYFGFYQNLLLLGGFIVTSLAFREVWSNGGGIFYLTIPGSLFEKFVSKLLVTSVGFAVGSTIFFTAAAAVAEGVSYLIAGGGHGFFNPLVPEVLRLMVIYLVTQSLFLVGSIWFRRLAFIKTALWAALFALAAGIVAVIAIRVGLAPHFAWHTVTAGHVQIGGWSLNLANEQLVALFAPGTRGYAGLETFATIGRVAFYLMAPVCWIAAYFRLAEAEV